MAIEREDSFGAQQHPGCWPWLKAMAGALALGVGLPVLLVNFSFGFHSLYKGNSNLPGMVSFGQRLNEALVLYVFGMIFCSPGVAILGSFVYSTTLTDVRGGAPWRATLVGGVVLGALLSFLNLPGWLCLELLRENTPAMKAVKAILLFLVGGSVAGAWIARTVWTVVYPLDGMIPRFSLTALLGLVLIWGALMGVFAPK